MNMEHAKTLVDLIEANPENLNMHVWHSRLLDSPVHTCNTVHCIAGFAQMLYRGIQGIELSDELVYKWINEWADDPETCARPDSGPTPYDARQYLEIEYEDAHWLFHIYRDWDEAKQFLLTGVRPDVV